MNPKEQENQLRLNLGFRIFLSVAVWFILAGVAGYRLWRLRELPLVSPGSVVNVPTINQDNLNTLRGSIKSPPASVNTLPVVRPEPFD